MGKFRKKQSSKWKKTARQEERKAGQIDSIL